MKNVSKIVSFLSVSIILLTLNRKTNFTQSFVLENQFLRWQDFHAMVSIPLLITLAYTLLFLQITFRKEKIHKRFGLFLLLFVFGTFLYGASSGNHEVTNYLHHRFCIAQENTICEIIRYNDDQFSHIVFYLSSILMTVALLLFEKLQPESKEVSSKNLIILLINAVLVAVGLFVNLAFEELGVDLFAFALLSLISIAMLLQVRKNFRKYPIILYCAVGYGIGTFASILYKLLF